jgi:hypothetical protein
MRVEVCKVYQRIRALKERKGMETLEFEDGSESLEEDLRYSKVQDFALFYICKNPMSCICKILSLCLYVLYLNFWKIRMSIIKPFLYQ